MNENFRHVFVSLDFFGSFLGDAKKNRYIYHMCGIAGIIGPNASEEDLDKMLQVQKHRGPDHMGAYVDVGFATIGHNRLSIIDLSAAANEPFNDNSGRYFLTFNGEIYNYKELRKELKDSYDFRTASDTEVLLAAYIKWGKACLDKFNGMFAFAIWDSEDKKLFAARDRFGVKPFYYTLQKGHFYFSSEIKALQAATESKTPNQKVWANYFTWGSYGMPSETFFYEILQLPGGHFLELSEGNLNIQRWYDFETRVMDNQKQLTFEEAKEAYLELLKDSIKLRFRADVPVGFNLSGGVDSSLLLALVNLFEEKKRIQAYTFYTGDSRYDELRWVEQMIATTENPLKKNYFSASEVRDTAKKIARLQDEPFGGIPTLAYSRIFRQAHQDGVKVLLDGQGMDEQWAGYDYYQTENAGTIQGTGQKNPFRPNVLAPEFAALAEKPEYPAPFDNRLQNLQYRDLFYTKIPRALRFNDRVSMVHSTELREPFLDHRLVEFAFSQPAEYKIKNGTGKYLLRELLKPMVPKDISYAPKRPLQTPQREWLAEELRPLVESSLENLKNSSFSEWFDFPKLEKEWKKYLDGDRESSFHVWQWVNLSFLSEK
ncbi:asparagine synthase (glutamine-hydrolysing) [Salinimicrobium catena]|uniref:asparagine synthase (glutamine-hydrolyzing) n=1 Tax=Salinimicrobium catena TaxID=390640 RepID=A0A1H5NBE0_9FLAO|nr:asparagine synthase (glutamine-hydrolyzing) [Salinimicrobium catena]SDL42077.1 asparagine synthase (glutamine-hydrolysing) [Salinimicrobium catena]SEE98949.1 asparagine synthase (glutamine-hydrolysing) [Salinimicrobium catena]